MIFIISCSNAIAFTSVVTNELSLALDSYGSIEQANAYFDNRLRNAAWTSAEPQEKKSALVEATRCIERLNYADSKVSERQFPRGTDTEVPLDIEHATYEIALKLLEGFDPELEMANLAAVSQGYSGARTTYDRSFVLEHVAAGIPSTKAWFLLKPYLRSIRELEISRVN